MLYLDRWIEEKIKKPLTQEALLSYQLEKSKETAVYAKNNSKFYKRLFDRYQPGNITSFADFEQLPFTTAGDLKEFGQDMICVSQNEISRIVTLDTSGTTGSPKRVFFTEEDQELTVDFFHNGMQYMAGVSERVLILLPCRRPGSVGDLLAKGLERIGAVPIRHGPVENLSSPLEILLKEDVRTIVGMPVQVLALAYAWKEWKEGRGNRPVAVEGSRGMGKEHGPPRDILLSTDYVAESLRKQLERLWNCRVFDHYGMTEMGLGGAVSCSILMGCHPREADLYFEIVDPVTGRRLPDGQHGEVVFTTLTRKGMPLVRYKTGDVGRFLQEKCPCGSILRRLDKVGHRRVEEHRISDRVETMASLDELVFQIDGVIDCRPYVIMDGNYQSTADREILRLKLYFSGQEDTLPRKLSKRKIER